MRQTILITLYFLYSLKVFAQSKDSVGCEKMKEYNKYLFFNTLGNPFVDNGLRCFDLSSVVPEINSCTRIWVYEVDYPDSPVLHRLKLFEIGVCSGKQYANYYTLEWEFQTNELGKVKCIKKEAVEPLHGWNNVEKKIKKYGLDKINTMQIPDYTDNVTDGFLILLQYVSSDKIINVDFSSYDRMGKSKYKRIRAFVSFLRLIKQEFTINMSLNKKGYDFLNNSPSKPQYIEKETPLDPVKSSP